MSQFVKRIIILFIFVSVSMLLTTGCSPRQRTLTREEAVRKLLGVKSQIKWNNDVVNQVRIYDDNGLKVQEIWKNPRGHTVTSRDLIYDDKTFNLKQVLWYKADDIEKSKYQYFYDRKGNLIQEKRLTPFDDLMLEKKYNYENKKLMKEIVSGSKGTLLTEKEYEYDNGNQIGFIERNNRGDIINRHRYEYDSNGQKILEQWFEKREEPILTKHFKYLNGLLIEELQYDRDGVLEQKILSEYDDNGLIQRKRWIDANENLILENVYTYGY